MFPQDGAQPGPDALQSTSGRQTKVEVEESYAVGERRELLRGFSWGKGTFFQAEIQEVQPFMFNL